MLQRFRGQIIAVLAVGLGVGAIVFTQPGGGGGGGSETANIWVDTNGGTCTDSASLVAYSDAAACSTWDAANDTCEAGDLVKVRPGSYPDQFLTGSNGRASNCVVDTEDGQEFNVNPELVENQSAARLTLSNFTIRSGETEHNGVSGNASVGMWNRNNATNVIWDNVDVTGPYALVDLKGDNVTHRNSAIGNPSNTAATPRLCGDDQEPVQISEGTDMVIEDNVYYPFFGEDVQANCGGSDIYHLETFRVWDTTVGLVIKDNYFADGDGSQSYRISFSRGGCPEATCPTSEQWKIINNYFGDICCAFSAPDVGFGDGEDCVGIVFAYNFFKNGPAGLFNNCATQTGMVYVGNMAAQNGGGCPVAGSSPVIAGNLFIGTSAGSCTGVSWVTDATPADWSAYNLTGANLDALTATSPSINAGENTRCTTYTANLDRLGQTRSGVCDAGPDEYVP
jgi:hypothetical protein